MPTTLPQRNGPSIVGRGGPALLAMLTALLLSGCSEKEAACEDAVRDALKDPGEYAAIRIDEQYGEGKAFNGYYVYFQYGTEGNFRGLAHCIYNNNSYNASVKIIG